MSYIPRYETLGPGVDSEWGATTNPFLPVVAGTYDQRMPPIASQIHGQRGPQMLPRPLGPGVQYLHGIGNALDGQYSLVQGYGGQPVGYGQHPEDEKVSLFILLALVGVLAYLWGASNGAKKNPRRNPMVNACTNPACEHCNWVDDEPEKNEELAKLRHAQACEQPRSRKTGRFVAARRRK